MQNSSSLGSTFTCRVPVDGTTVGLSDQLMECAVWGEVVLKIVSLLFNLGLDLEELHFLGVILLLLFLMHIVSFAFLQAHSLGFKWNVAKSITETK